MEFVSTPDPHFIPGYTGYCPQLKYQIGDTYAATTNKVLLDPHISHAENLVLSDYHNYQVPRPTQKEIDLVNKRYGNTLYKHPLNPSYQGFVPREKALFGERFPVQATKALYEFEKLQEAKRRNKISALRNGLDKKKTMKSQFRFPLKEVRPECMEMIHEAASCPCLEEGNFVTKGSSEQIPFGFSCLERPGEAMTNSALCDYTSKYRRKLSTEWIPVNVARPEPNLLIQPTQIYHKNIGLLPNYCGHVPGAVFRYGQTFGNDSRDAKRWLRGDYRQYQ